MTWFERCQSFRRLTKFCCNTVIKLITNTEASLYSHIFVWSKILGRRHYPGNRIEPSVATGRGVYVYATIYNVKPTWITFSSSSGVTFGTEKRERDKIAY